MEKLVRWNTCMEALSVTWPCHVLCNGPFRVFQSNALFFLHFYNAVEETAREMLSDTVVSQWNQTLKWTGNSMPCCFYIALSSMRNKIWHACMHTGIYFMCAYSPNTVLGVLVWVPDITWLHHIKWNFFDSVFIKLNYFYHLFSHGEMQAFMQWVIQVFQ